MRIGLGINLRQRVTGPAPFTPLSLSPTAWYDPSDMSTLFQDTAGTVPVTASGQSVARINDKSGNGNHLTQATVASQPVYTDTAGVKYLLLDGSDDFLTRATFVAGALAQPFRRVSGLQQVTWVLNDYIIEGGAANNTHLFQGNGAIGSIAIYPGTTVLSHAGAAAGVDIVAMELFNGASSELGVDATAAAVGGAGTVAMNGFCIGGNSAALRANLRWHGSIVGNFDATGAANARTWMAAKQGRVL